MTRHVKSGTGWRLGWDSDAPRFKGLVGGEVWSVELTEAEFKDFCRLVSQLSDTMTQMASELMDEEKITCEAESDRLWLEVSGYPHAYDLRFILLTDRRAEGGWPAEVVADVIRASQTLNVF